MQGTPWSCAPHSAPSPSTAPLGLAHIWVSKVKKEKKATPQRDNVKLLALGNLETLVLSEAWEQF